MPRIRTIKPEALQHRKIGRLSHVAFRLWIGLITQADDHGRGVADLGQLHLVAFGYHDDVTEGKVADALQEIAGLGLIRLYDVESTPYYYFPGWADHQKISHPGKPLCPKPPESSGALQSPLESSRTFLGDQGSRIKEGIKEGTAGPSSWLDYLGTVDSAGRDVLGQIPEAVARTRKTGRVAPSILDNLARECARYPAAAVVAGARIYLDRSYAAEGKDEKYLLGIVRREAEGASRNGNGFHPSVAHKTEGRARLERALRQQDAEREAR